MEIQSGYKCCRYWLLDFGSWELGSGGAQDLVLHKQPNGAGTWGSMNKQKKQRRIVWNYGIVCIYVYLYERAIGRQNQSKPNWRVNGKR
jgi:hypothetical protein